MVQSSEVEIRIPTPLLLWVELCRNLYCFALEQRKIFSTSSTVSRLLRRMSDKKIISLPKSIRDLIFLVCFGQLVDIFRELQFWMETDRCWRTAAKFTNKGPCPWVAWLGERSSLFLIHRLSFLSLMEVKDIQGDVTWQTQVQPVGAILGVNVDS